MMGLFDVLTEIVHALQSHSYACILKLACIGSMHISADMVSIPRVVQIWISLIKSC
jgi:hypothetical protein